MDIPNQVLSFDVTGRDGKTYRHPRFGLLFRRRKSDDESLVEYFNAPELPIPLQDRRDFRSLLVRHGEGDNIHYYPAYLLFVDKKARHESSKERGVRAPRESWIEEMRKAVVEKYGPVDASKIEIAGKAVA